MDQLVNQIAQRTGMSQAQAQQAAQMVVGYLKNKLPGPVASQIDSALGMQGTGGMPGQSMPGQSQQAQGGAGDMFSRGQPSTQ